MSAPGVDTGNWPVVRYASYKIRTEEEYEVCMSRVRQLVLSAEGTSVSRWCALMDELDVWEIEDARPSLPLPTKKRKLQHESEVVPLSATSLVSESPPPWRDVQSPPPGQGSASSSVPAVPLTPPELLSNAVSMSAKDKAELVARNKAAALLKRQQKLVADQLATGPSESEFLQWL